MLICIYVVYPKLEFRNIFFMLYYFADLYLSVIITFMIFKRICTSACAMT